MTIRQFVKDALTKMRVQNDMRYAQFVKETDTGTQAEITTEFTQIRSDINALQTLTDSLNANTVVTSQAYTISGNASIAFYKMGRLVFFSFRGNGTAVSSQTNISIDSKYAPLNTIQVPVIQSNNSDGSRERGYLYIENSQVQVVSTYTYGMTTGMYISKS